MQFRLPVIALLAAGTGALALWMGPDSGPAQRRSPLPQKPAAEVFGPGAWVAPQQDDAAPAIADPALSLTADGDLLIDPALLHFLDLRFAERPGTRAIDLVERDLRTSLSGKALAQALELAHAYPRYITQYDALLAAQNLNGMADLARLRGWAQQRHQLRQRIFGNAVALAWFDNDEANLATAIDELEQRAAGAVAEETVTDPRYGPSAELRRIAAEAHAARLRHIVDAATRGFSSPVQQG